MAGLDAMAIANALGGVVMPDSGAHASSKD